MKQLLLKFNVLTKIKNKLKKKNRKEIERWHNDPAYRLSAGYINRMSPEEYLIQPPVNWSIIYRNEEELRKNNVRIGNMEFSKIIDKNAQNSQN